MRFTRKSIRLPAGSYVGPRIYFVTICCEGRKPALADAEWVSRCIVRLREASTASLFSVHAYCFMPDHVHLLAEGRGAESSLRAFLSRFKQFTAFEYQRKTGTRLWQTKFYDYVLRQDAEMDAARKRLEDLYATRQEDELLDDDFEEESEEDRNLLEAGETGGTENAPMIAPAQAADAADWSAAADEGRQMIQVPPASMPSRRPAVGVAAEIGELHGFHMAEQDGRRRPRGSC